MVKLTLSMFIAVLPALALANWDIEARAISENDLFGRELSEAETIVFARDIEKLFTRMTQEDELTRRHLSEKLKKIFAKMKNLFGREDELDGRELDELYERDPELEREFGEREINDLD